MSKKQVMTSWRFRWRSRKGIAPGLTGNFAGHRTDDLAGDHAEGLSGSLAGDHADGLSGGPADFLARDRADGNTRGLTGGCFAGVLLKITLTIFLEVSLEITLTISLEVLLVITLTVSLVITLTVFLEISLEITLTFFFRGLAGDHADEKELEEEGGQTIVQLARQSVLSSEQRASTFRPLIGAILGVLYTSPGNTHAGIQFSCSKRPGQKETATATIFLRYFFSRHALFSSQMISEIFRCFSKTTIIDQKVRKKNENLIKDRRKFPRFLEPKLTGHVVDNCNEEIAKARSNIDRLISSDSKRYTCPGHLMTRQNQRRLLCPGILNNTHVSCPRISSTVESTSRPTHFQYPSSYYSIILGAFYFSVLLLFMIELSVVYFEKYFFGNYKERNFVEKLPQKSVIQDSVTNSKNSADSVKIVDVEKSLMGILFIHFSLSHLPYYKTPGILPILDLIFCSCSNHIRKKISSVDDKETQCVANRSIKLLGGRRLPKLAGAHLDAKSENDKVIAEPGNRRRHI
ncbi:Protein of unknown function [Cotesia congregata]|uniref:Uncharacterized protein n=1 Tax=Cotesia congregata TaxID=51543 RepID=A0A8J2HMX4_COTCN|nr:Protein of unknown function [Cotesia congregata]